MKVAEYRSLISAVSDARVSLMSAATDHEQRCEARRLHDAAEELRTACCPRASKYDRDHADRLLATVDDYLARKRAQFQAADAQLTRMAFCGEWK